MEPISASLETEVANLRQRLEEAEDVRRAIIGGEVDAFVVGPGSSSRVLLLANAYQRYRQLVERMTQGAITATIDGNILFANQRFSDMLGVPLAQLYSAPLESYVMVGDRARLGSFLMLSSFESRIEVQLSRRDGNTVPVRLAVASLADSYTTLIVTDLRPRQWPSLAIEVLDSIRNSVERLNREVGANPGARDALQDISQEINALARMIDEMLDVEALGAKPSSNP